MMLKTPDHPECSLTALAILFAPLASAAVDDEVRALQREWEEIKYRKPVADQEKAFEALSKTADHGARESTPTAPSGHLVRDHPCGSLRGANGGVRRRCRRRTPTGPRARAHHRPEGRSRARLHQPRVAVLPGPAGRSGFGDDKSARACSEAALKLNPDASTRTRCPASARSAYFARTVVAVFDSASNAFSWSATACGT